jgi:hypothetical protein
MLVKCSKSFKPWLVGLACVCNNFFKRMHGLILFKTVSFKLFSLMAVPYAEMKLSLDEKSLQ